MKFKSLFVAVLFFCLSSTLWSFVISGQVADANGSYFSDIKITLEWVGTNYNLITNNANGTLGTNFYDPNNVSKSTNYTTYRSNFTTFSDTLGYYSFKSVSNFRYTLAAFPPSDIAIAKSSLIISNLTADLTNNFLVTLTNLNKLPDTLFPAYYLASRQDYLPLEILKSNFTSERVIVSLIKVNGKDKIKLVDAYFSAMNNRTLVSSESLRKVLTTGPYIVETKIVPTGKNENDLGLPINRRLFIYSE